MKLLRICCLALPILAALGLSVPARAAYPEHQIKLVVPYTPGGPADILGRIIAEKMSAVLGQPVIIENKPGAGLTLGADYAARAKPDGYTLFLGAASMLINSSPGRTPEQNLRDFTAITTIGTFPEVVVVNRELPVTTIPELIAYAKAHPGDLNYSSSGVGSLTHMAGALFTNMAHIDMLHVPYRGINEALTDLLGGRVQAAFPGAPIGLPLAKGGRVRAIAVTGSQRTAIAPDLPTVAESGLPGYDVSPWYGVLAPVGTPPEVIARWHDEIVRIMQTDEIKQRWLTFGADAVYSKTPQDFSTLMQNETLKWAKLVKEAGIKLQ
jgi:tripartite-type tricarboxylate transporter receptor subunit TctC